MEKVSFKPAVKKTGRERERERAREGNDERKDSLWNIEMAEG